jgi:hypothetical protein
VVFVVYDHQFVEMDKRSKAEVKAGEGKIAYSVVAG